MPPAKDKISSPDYPQLGRIITEASGNLAACKPSPGLYLVATPIGNRGDITLRALITLSQADLIACEDSRNSGILLHAYGIDTPTISYHDHNADTRRPEIIQRLQQGKTIALISDAGTPAIADPGFKLVRACHEANIPVTVIPGANAAVTAMAASGLPTDQFLFAGFLPPKSAGRRKTLTELQNCTASLVFYESPQRLAASLDDMAATLGSDRQAVVARELTKYYEEFRRGTLAELAAHYAATEAKGEIVIIIDKAEPQKTTTADIDHLLIQSLTTLSLRDAVAAVAEATGTPKKQVYARALTLTAAKPE